MKKIITSFFICWREALLDILGDFLPMKSKQKLDICHVEAVLKNFSLDFCFGMS